MQSQSARITLAIVVAAATPATTFALFELLDQLPRFTGSDIVFAFRAATSVWVIAFCIALLHAISLGLPAYFVAARLNFTKWWVSLVCGFLIGSLPAAIYSWPVGHNYSSRAWDGQRTADYVIDCVPTAAGWMQYLHSVGGIGLVGMT